MEKKKSAASIAFRWAFIAALVVFGYTLFLYAINQHMNQALGWVASVFFLGGMIWCVLQRRNKNAATKGLSLLE